MPTPREGYFAADGTVLPGTTTVINRFKESGGLLYWACTVGYAQGRAGEKMNLYAKRDEAADVGTFVHECVFNQLHGKPQQEMPREWTSEMCDQAKNGYENYFREMQRTKAFIQPWEKPLVSEEYRYGGTPDGLVEFEDVVDLADWKTGKSVYSDHIIQGAAYRRLLHENTKLKIRGVRIYLFSKEGGKFSEHYYGPEILDIAFEQFVNFRRAWDVDKKLKWSL